jgi:hypothetical protein
MAEFHFRSMEASQNKSDVTIQFMVGGLVIHFAGIFHPSASVQKFFKNFMFMLWLKTFVNFFGQIWPVKFSLHISTPSKDTTLKKFTSIEALWPRWLLPFGL